MRMREEEEALEQKDAHDATLARGAHGGQNERAEARGWHCCSQRKLKLLDEHERAGRGI